MIYFGASDVGLKRKENQDSFCVVENKHHSLLGIVCDGIGGGKAGGVASSLAIDSLKNAFLQAEDFQDDVDVKRWIYKVVQQANDDIFAQSMKSIEQKGMGTTCVGVLINQDATYIFNVGDSRIYGLYKEFVCLTEDHSLVQDLLKNGDISEEEALRHPNRNMLTNALGIWDNVKVDVNKIKGDYRSLLICSDGLHGYVEEADIYRIMTSSDDIRRKVQACIHKSKEAGGYDNVSVILLEKEEGE